MNYKIIIIAIFCFFTNVNATVLQENNGVRIDSSSVNTKKFSTSIPEKYIDNDFNYNESVNASQNYLLRAIRWFFDKLNSIFGIDVDPSFFKLVEILIYIILIIIATYIIIRLFAGTKATAFFSKKSKELAPLKYEEEHIEEIDLEELLQQALSVSDYRLAVRYMYLKVLKDLSLKNLIDWHYDKTNFDYTNEIESPKIKNLFKNVSHVYDHIWYGEFNLNKERFNIAFKDFDQLTKAINKNG